MQNLQVRRSSSRIEKMVSFFRFITIPQNAVVMTVSDGKRQLAVTEPLGAVSPGDLAALRDGDTDAQERFFRDNAALKSKLDRAADILGDALRQIDTTNTSIDSRIGILEYFNRVIEQEAKLHGTRRGDRISKYRAGVKALAKYLAETGRTAETLDCLDADLMAGFDAWMQRRRLLRTTREFYIRRISALYSHAVRDGLILDARPFDAPLRALTHHLTHRNYSTLI